MPDYRRWRVAGGTYFFTVVVHQRRPILTGAMARHALRQALSEVRRTRPFTLDAIVLLPDHLHPIWTLPAGDVDYATRWRLIKSRFTQSYLASGGVEAPRSASRHARRERGVWQRRYFEHTVRDERDMKRCVDYIHVNPLKHGLVERVVDWPWSSFHRYLKLGEYGPDWGSANIWYGDEWNHFE